MTDIVPFQAKRKIQFNQDTTPQAAIALEIERYFQRTFPNFKFPAEDVIQKLNNTSVLGKQSVKGITLVTLAELLAPFSSEKTTSLPRDFASMELLQLSTTHVAQQVGVKRPYRIFPKPYQKMLKRIFTAQETLERLSTELTSKKKAKKYLRIFIKRMGFYTQKKAPFQKRTLTSV